MDRYTFSRKSVFNYNCLTYEDFTVLYYDPPNAQLFHKLSHCYMFRHYRVILRELVIYTLPSYTSMLNAAFGNKI